MGNLCAPDNAHNTILHYGAQNGSVAILEYLATISPECMSEKNCEGKTHLDVAILFENQDAVAFLLGITNKMRLYTPKESDNDDEG